MLEFSQNFQNSIDSQVLTMATCIKIKLQDGRRIAFTTHTSNLRFIEEPDLIYYSKGFTPTAVSKNNSMSVDNADGDMIIDNNNILKDDLESGIYNNAYYELFDINWMLKTNGFYSYADRFKDINGTIGEVKREKLQYTTEYRSLAQYLATTIINVYKASCDATFGDPKRCKKDLTGLMKNASISAIITNSSFIVNDLNDITGEYDNGVIEFTSGRNKGKKYTVKKWDLTTKNITLIRPVNYPVQVGDTAIFTSGCNHTKNDCKYFNNYINYQGFVDIPGMDFIMSGGGTKVNYG